MSEREFSRKVGANLRMRREALGLRQVDVALAAGVSRAAISSWELGGKPITAYVLMVVDQLLGLQEKERRAEVMS